jgi:excinuclease UvrABC nuclease subunit
MMYGYKGNFAYNKFSVQISAPECMGVYYCGKPGSNGGLFPLYIGRAKGDGVSIRSRLLDHIRDDYWPDATLFGYHVCTTKTEAENLEAQEIRKYNPKYNTQLKSARTTLLG